MDTADRVRQFIKDNFYAASASDLTDDASLLDLGIVDSTGILEVVAFLEDEFQITVDDAEMLPENLDSIQNIVAFVERKTTA
ncbi:MAG TPA: acyl carrier protein [Polyangiaceae bacterium]|jgi:acyl carrier protein|nr:MAG: acyl carrier protein [Deltaproteobacteria bacterium ADurb.Bin207]HNS96815.1 acyl carrier protein [Polyangiaceae bacterium]HNZ23291.1 acyl carrier protein [Polyangiaceae bacterium]HOD21939.1 acyl carrier protein [Polyangiaceae bacterium]HOE49384.1 acyl carrier protein [Polyangiaceae bacterium]